MGSAFNNFFPRGENPIGPYLAAHPEVFWPVIALLILIAIVYPFFGGFAMDSQWRAATSLLVSSVSSYLVVVMYSLLQPEAKTWASAVLPTFLSCLAIWLFTFHWLAHHLGYYPRCKYGDGRPWIKHWVREIDYVYLSISSLSLLKLVLSELRSADELKGYNAVAVVALGVALALRITKTSIEVWDWDNKNRAPAGWPSRSRFYKE
jgi:hypothetical protein